MKLTKSFAFKSAALVAVAALSLTGCSASTSSSYKACMVSDAGGFKDASFNEEAYNGLQNAKKDLGIQVATVQSPETATQTDYVTGVQSMIDAKCNLIIGVGFNLATAVRDAAKANPKVDFALIDSALSNDDYSALSLDNVKPIQYDTAQAAFLAGYLAAAKTATGKIATYGGMLLPSVTIFMDGLKQGVDYYNKQNSKSVVVLGAQGTDTSKWAATGDFNDQSKGKTLTEQFFAQGADIVLPVAGPVGIGSGQATLDKPGTEVIGVDSDWYNLPAHAAYKANILTSIEKKMAAAVESVIKDGVNGKFMGGDVNQYVGTLANGGVQIADQHDVMYPDGIAAKLADLKAQIIAGTIKVTSQYNK